jgi:hypothetical protein
MVWLMVGLKVVSAVISAEQAPEIAASSVAGENPST